MAKKVSICITLFLSASYGLPKAHCFALLLIRCAPSYGRYTLRQSRPYYANSGHPVHRPFGTPQVRTPQVHAGCAGLLSLSHSVRPMQVFCSFRPRKEPKEGQTKQSLGAIVAQAEKAGAIFADNTSQKHSINYTQIGYSLSLDCVTSRFCLLLF